MAIEETPDGLTFIHLEKSIVVNDSSGNLLASKLLETEN